MFWPGDFFSSVYLTTYYTPRIRIVRLLAKNRAKTKEDYPRGRSPADLSSEYVRLLSAEKTIKPQPNWLEQGDSSIHIRRYPKGGWVWGTVC